MCRPNSILDKVRGKTICQLATVRWCRCVCHAWYKQLHSKSTWGDLASRVGSGRVGSVYVSATVTGFQRSRNFYKSTWIDLKIENCSVQEQHYRDEADFGPVRDFCVGLSTSCANIFAIFDVLIVGDFWYITYKTLCFICFFSLLASAGECEA